MTPSYVFEAELWLHPGEAPWHFLTVPANIADEIAEETSALVTASKSASTSSPARSASVPVPGRG
ncbi:DUF1905 domain-containing protein [Arthrobacter sp. RC1.1 241]|uniref:DUF1905 domain-containing protein n=1 Tax=Paenarthrobacter sp. 22069 TaxID=3453864 RepID=UPI0015E8B45E